MHKLYKSCYLVTLAVGMKVYLRSLISKGVFVLLVCFLFRSRPYFPSTTPPEYRARLKEREKKREKENKRTAYIELSKRVRVGEKGKEMKTRHL